MMGCVAMRYRGLQRSLLYTAMILLCASIALHARSALASTDPLHKRSASEALLASGQRRAASPAKALASEAAVASEKADRSAADADMADALERASRKLERAAGSLERAASFPRVEPDPDQGGSDGRCYPFQTFDNSICQSVLQNTSVYIPSMSSFSQINLELSQFVPLIKVGCSANMSKFVCHYYLPTCDARYRYPIGPCRDLCQAVRDRCEPLMQRFGFAWPSALNCANFLPSSERTCFGLNDN